jgi:DNA polymerase-1
MYDTYIAAGITNITAERRLGLKELTRNWLGRDVGDITDINADADLTYADIREVTRYAGDDACNALSLYLVSEKRMVSNPSVRAVFNKIEMPVVDITRRMEHRGILLDEEVLLAIHKSALQVERESLAKLRKISGYQFDPAKTTHVRHMFYDVFCLREGKSAGRVTSDRKQLALLYEEMDKTRKDEAKEFFDAFMLNKEASKIRTTYTHSLLDLRTPDGRIHPGFLQVNAASGRYTSRGPNFQNLPRDDSGLFDVRSAFVADPGYVFVVYDFRQMEFKLAAAYSQDPFLVKAANDSTIDVHNNTARACFDLSDKEEVAKSQRQAAKTITFAILFGATGFGLSRQLVGVSPKRGEELVDKFYNAYSGLKEWTDKLRAEISKQGFAQTYFGRRRWGDRKKLLDPKEYVSEAELRKLANTVIQGTGADITKIAMKQVDRRLRIEHLDAQIVGQIHDELIVLCPEGQADAVSQIMQEEMTSEVFGVTLPVDGAIKLNLSKHEEN